MRLLFTLLIFIFGNTVSADVQDTGRLCQVPEGNSQEVWKIPEERFTKQNAQIALDKLTTLMADGDKDNEYFADKYAVSYSAAVHNALIIIKGYALKMDALRHPEGPERDIFCRFLKEEAIIWH